MPIKGEIHFHYFLLSYNLYLINAPVIALIPLKYFFYYINVFIYYRGPTIEC